MKLGVLGDHLVVLEEVLVVPKLALWVIVEVVRSCGDILQVLGIF